MNITSPLLNYNMASTKKYPVSDKSKRMVIAYNKVLDITGMTGADFKSKHGVDPSVISRLLNGYQKTSDPLFEVLMSYNISERYLNAGEGSMFISINKIKESVGTIESRIFKIIEAIKEQNRIKSDMSFLADMPYDRSIISRVRKEGIPFPDDFVDVLIKKYRANRKFINSGEGEMFYKNGEEDIPPPVIWVEKESETNSRFTLTDPERIILPFIDIPTYATFVNYCHSPAITLEDFKTIIWVKDPTLSTNYNNVFVVEVSGDSMYPTLIDKAKILIQEIPHGDFQYIQSGVYSIVYGNAFVTKRIKEVNWKSEKVRLYSDNERAGYMDIETIDIHCIYKVLEVRQKVS